MDVIKKMEVLKSYKYETKLGNYVSERFKVDKGIYDFIIYLDNEIITEEKNVLVKTGRDLEKHIRKVIKNYEKDLETEKIDEIDESIELEDMQEAIDNVLAEEDLKEEEIEEVKEDLEEEIEEIDLEEVNQKVVDIEIEEVDLEDESQRIDAVFTKRKTSMEMQELFKIIDTKIRNIDGVSFKTTTLDLVYQVMKKNFLRIRPVSNLTVMTAPDYYKNIIKITDEKEIDDAMVSIIESCEFIREKRNKK